MRAIRTGLKYSSRTCTSVFTAMVSLLTLCVSGTVAMAQIPASGKIVVNQSTKYGSLATGGSQSGSVPAGDTMAVNTLGDVITTNTYGNQTLLFTPAGGTPTVLGTTSNPTGVAVDAQNNLYMGFSYNNAVIKIPYVNGAYAAVGAPITNGNPYPAGTPNCTGTDTVECVMSNVIGASGVVSMVFDAKGDLFYTTAGVIYECTAACLYSGTPAPATLYTEPASATPTTTGQLTLGGLALDSSNNLFFTDSAVSSTTSQESFSSNLNELPYTAGTGYATAATVIYTYKPASAAQYGAEIDGVGVAPNGTIYALIQAAQGSQSGSPAQGIFAFPKTNGTYSNTSMYLVSTQSGKLMTNDAVGNLYIADNGGNIYQIAIDTVTAPPTPSGTPSSATNLTTLLNDGGCTTPPTVTFTPSGTSAADFTLATTGACTVTGTGGASFATTLNFSPTTVGLATATIMSMDSVGSTGTAEAFGNATGTVAEPTFSPAGGTYTAAQQVTISDATAGASIYYTTDGTTPGAGTGTSTLYTAPVAVSSSETINAIAIEAGDTSSAVASAVYSVNLPGAALTPTFSPAGGAYSTPQDVTISDGTTGAIIYYTTNGSTPTTSSNVYVGPVPVAATETLKAIAVATGASPSAVASALYTLTLPASAFQNIVMTQSTQYGSLPSSGGAQSGSEPAGDSMAVTSFGGVIATDTYGSQTLLFTPGATAATVLGTTSNPNGVAVDAENNLFQAFSYNNAVVKIPYVNGAYAAFGAPVSGGNPYPNGTPNCTGNDKVECLMSNLKPGADVESMVFDSNGDMFYATGRSKFVIYECTAACLYTGSPAPMLLYTEPTSSTPTTTGQLWIGGLALDAAGDLFFTDSAISSTTSQESFSSNLNELPYTAGTGYATKATVIYTYTPKAAAQYGAEIDGVAVAPNGTVYALIQAASGSQTGSPAQGILAFPYVSGSYSSKNMYLVSTQSGKLMTSDGLGNLYIADNGGNIFQIAVDSLTAPSAPQGNPNTTSNITTYLNDGGCTATPPTVTFAASGSASAAFSAATTGTCTATATGGASYATTLTFDPTAVGPNTATLTATDSLMNTGMASVFGVGTPAPPAPAPTFSVAAGTYTTVQSVALADTVTTAAIYYTLDGSTPTSKSSLYSAPITVSASETINAIATATGYQTSTVATAAYVINLPVAPTPTFSVKAGTYTTPQMVSISDSVTGLAIYYTTDGSTPTAGTGTSKLYTAPLTLLATETIQAIAVPTATTPNYTDSVVASALYTINLPVVATPTFSVTAGTYQTVQTVSISDSTSGATIYYTTNGTTPTAASTPYTAPILVPVTTTIEAIAIDSPNYNNSTVATALYTINLPAPGYTLTSSNTTVTISGGKGTVTLTLTANAAFNGTASFSCAGFLPIGASCTFTPTSVSANALGTATTQLTVTVPQSSAQLHHGPNPLIPGTTLAAMLGLLGLSRKRRRLQVLLLLVFGVFGMNALSGCATTSPSTATSSQMIVNSAGSSLPVNATKSTQPTPVSETLTLVLDTQ